MEERNVQFSFNSGIRKIEPIQEQRHNYSDAQGKKSLLKRAGSKGQQDNKWQQRDANDFIGGKNNKGVRIGNLRHMKEPAA